MHEEWTNAWFSESEALEWRNAGFTLKQALVFRGAKITVDQAIVMREHQVRLNAQPNYTNEIMHKAVSIIKVYPKLIGTIMGIIFFILLMVVLLKPGNNQVNVLGDWSGQITTMGTSSSTGTIEIDREDEVTGNISGLEEGMPFTGNVNGNNIDITWYLDNPPQTTVELTGTVEGNEITGNLEITSPSGSESGTITLQRDRSLEAQ